VDETICMQGVFGATYRMVPMKAVSDVSEDRVTVNFDREKATAAPAFDTNVVPGHDYQRDLHDYYGYSYPGWARW
jgi:hypothetical protein